MGEKSKRVKTAGENSGASGVRRRQAAEPPKKRAARPERRGDLLRSDAGQKAAAAALQQETEMFLDLINTQPVGIYRIRVFSRRKWRPGAWRVPRSAPYCVELASERFCEILGISRQAFESTPGIVEEMVHPEDRDDWVRRNTEANARLVPFEWEGRLRVGRREIWVHFESLPRLLADGDVLWTGFLHDITGRRAAEEALVRSEASLRREQNFNHLLLNNTSALIVAMDLDGKTLMMNKALLNALEYAEEEVRGTDYLSTFVPEADREMVAAVFRKIIHEGMATINENRIVSRSGQTFLVEWHGGIAKQEAGIPGFFVGVGIDVSERKQAQQRLHESEERLRLLSDNLPGGMVYQIDSGPDGRERRFTYLSAGVAKLHDVPAADALRDATLIYGQLDRQDAEKVAELESQAAATMRPFNAEVRVRLPSGEVRWRLFTSAPRRTPDGRLIWDGIEVDIDESKRAEAERERLHSLLLHSQKMDSIGRLAGGVAHDFNNMLEVILIQADMAAQKLGADHPGQGDLRVIRQAASRSAELTRHLLAFARRQIALPRLLDLNEAVAKSLDMLRRLVGEDKALEWRPGSGLGPVLIDPQQLVQLLTNLCLNARDAIAGVGCIEFSTAAVCLDAAACTTIPGAVPGEYARLTVRDSGCGMGPDILERIFEPFFTTKPQGRGTGLGLPAAYGIVQQNGGFITVDSEPGRGSAFAVHLPRQVGKAQSERDLPRGHGELQGNGTVLVVEDEPAILDIVTVLLRQQGYTVLEAASPGEALRLAEGHAGDIDLLLTDVIMPEMNGRELARQLLARHAGLRRLFMSGHASDIIAGHGLMDGKVNFIAKPFSMEELLAKVREVLEAG